MVHCPGSVTQGPETFSQGTEAAGVGAAAKTKPCGSNSTAAPTAPTVEHKDTRGAFWYGNDPLEIKGGFVCIVLLFDWIICFYLFYMQKVKRTNRTFLAMPL